MFFGNTVKKSAKNIYFSMQLHSKSIVTKPFLVVIQTMLRNFQNNVPMSIKTGLEFLIFCLFLSELSERAGLSFFNQTSLPQIFIVTGGVINHIIVFSALIHSTLKRFQ